MCPPNSDGNIASFLDSIVSEARSVVPSNVFKYTTNDKLSDDFHRMLPANSYFEKASKDYLTKINCNDTFVGGQDKSTDNTLPHAGYESPVNHQVQSLERKVGLKPKPRKQFTCRFTGCTRGYTSEDTRRRHYRHQHAKEWSLVKRSRANTLAMSSLHGSKNSSNVSCTNMPESDNNGSGYSEENDPSDYHYASDFMQNSFKHNTTQQRQHSLPVLPFHQVSHHQTSQQQRQSMPQQTVENEQRHKALSFYRSPYVNEQTHHNLELNSKSALASSCPSLSNSMLHNIPRYFSQAENRSLHDMSENSVFRPYFKSEHAPSRRYTSPSPDVSANIYTEQTRSNNPYCVKYAQPSLMPTQGYMNVAGSSGAQYSPEQKVVESHTHGSLGNDTSPGGLPQNSYSNSMLWRNATTTPSDAAMKQGFAVDNFDMNVPNMQPNQYSALSHINSSSSQFSLLTPIVPLTNTDSPAASSSPVIQTGTENTVGGYFTPLEIENLCVQILRSGKST
eukprot:CFRG0326T1